MTTPAEKPAPSPDAAAPPRPTRASVGRERRRRRAVLAVAALAAIVAIAGITLARSGMLRGDGPVSAAIGSTGEETASAQPPEGSRAAEAGTRASMLASAALEPTVVAPPAAQVEIEIGWVGDTTPGSKYGNPPDEGRALFEHTRELLSAPDIMVANLEGTFGVGGPSKCDGRDSSACYAFQAPPANAAALAWAGIDVVNLANNHSNDYFAAGLASTREALEANSVDYTGLDDVMAIREFEGVRVAFLGFSPYAWSLDLNDIEAAKALVADAAKQVDVVVVLIHAGAEGSDKIHTPRGAETAYGENRGDSRAFAHAVIDAGADLVLGSGPHVIRGMEQYRGRLIAYSLGNFAGWRNFSRAGDLALSGLLTVRVAGDGRVLGGRWTALRIAEPGVPKPDPDGASLTLVRELSQADFDSPVVPDATGAFTLSAE